MSAAMAMMLLRVRPAGRGIANSSDDGILAFLEIRAIRVGEKSRASHYTMF